jgi:hypothetical protein
VLICFRQVFGHYEAKVTNTKIWYQKSGLLLYLAMWFLSVWNTGMGGIWKKPTRDGLQ